MAYPPGVGFPPYGVPDVTAQLGNMSISSGKSLLVNGAIVHLWSKRSGHNLRIGEHGDVSAQGRNGEHARFIVHVDAYGVVALQNQKCGNHWWAIKNGAIIGTGTGGPFCQFNVIDHGNGFISLESVQARGHYIGVNGDGSCKTHLSGGISDDEKFYVLLVQPASGQINPPGSRLLTGGAQVRLWSNAHGKNVRIQDNGAVDGKGWSAFYALFTVHIRGQGIVALQNVQNPNHWITIKNGQTVGTGTGGPFTELRVHDSANGMVCFESVQHPGQHLGIVPDGSLKPPTATGTGEHGRFRIIVDKPGAAVPSMAPMPPHAGYPQPTPQWGHPTAPQGGIPPQAAMYPPAGAYHPAMQPAHGPPTGQYAAQGLLVNGAIVHLWSKRSGQNLRIGEQGDVSAQGRNGEHARFIVHVNAYGVVALQNQKCGNHWWAIKNGTIIGTGTGGPFCQFNVIDHGNGFISLESVQARGHYIGVNGDGSCKTHLSGGISDDEKFYVLLVQPASGQTVPPGSRLLTGGARVRLWSNAQGKNVRIQDNGAVDGRGCSGCYALFTVHIRGQGIVALQNVQNPNHWITIKNGQTVGTGTGGPFTELRVHDSDNGMVCFESVQHPGQHLGIVPDGSLKPPTATGRGEHGRFRIILA